ncbi:hypothetical protein [Lysinibacillus sphaericus]|uniref:hypothetical protein n=1 Tax=Lysinibacillus sphaericus TaxID=1421 RepID=UPI001CC09391|nr:hypothetical protein [Lysinibacillus sphaericus]
MFICSENAATATNVFCAKAKRQRQMYSVAKTQRQLQMYSARKRSVSGKCIL